MTRLVGLAALAAFIAYCFARDREPRVAARFVSRRDGDGEPRRLPRPPAPHVHAGDPSVRH